MQYFTEQGLSYSDVKEKIQRKYGENAKILTQRSIRYGGFLGLFPREGVEASGIISPDFARKKKTEFEEEKRKILSIKNEPSLTELLDEIKDVKEKLNFKQPAAVQSGKHASIRKIEEILSRNDFSFSFIDNISRRLEKELSLEQLNNMVSVKSLVLDWISETLNVYEEKQSISDSTKIFILVGPTGVGKTTTIAKLAAIYSGLAGVGNQKQNVRMITIDNYRIGAKKQIETYGEIMNIPVSCVSNYEDLRKKIMLYQGVDVILVDTIGKSPKDYLKLAEMRELLEGCGDNTEVHLAVSSTTKSSDIMEIMLQFEAFKYQSVILTKLDETVHVGNVISALWEKQKKVSFITNGQGVPQDIEKADIERLLIKIEGLDYNKQIIETEYLLNNK